MAREDMTQNISKDALPSTQGSATMIEATDMTHKITKKIVGYKVLTKDDAEPVKQEPEQPSVESMHENVDAPGSAARFHLQNQNPAVGTCAVHHHQRHDPERRHPPRRAPALRDLHQLQKHGAFPVGAGADPADLGSIPQRRRRVLSN